MTTMVKQSECPPINVKSTGRIQYQMSIDDKNQRYIQLIASTSGGFVSQNKVAVIDIQKILMTVTDEAHFSSTIFKRLFAGKSANNASFLAAVLRAEGVIAKSHRHTYCHVIDDIDAISYQPKKAKS